MTLQAHSPLEELPAPGVAPSPALRRLWLGLIVVLVAVEAVLTLSDAGLLGSQRWRAWAYEYGAFWSGLLKGWEPNFAAQSGTMLFTYAFLHTGWAHLGGNALALVWLGLRLEQGYDATRFAVVYMFSAMGAALAFAYWPGGSFQPMVGASGAIMGLVAVWAVQDMLSRQQRGTSRRRLAARAALYVAVVVAVHLTERWLGAGQMAWQAHLGGALTGLVAVAALPGLRPTPAE